MSAPIRIGTRDSELALWQANTVKKKLQQLGHEAELVPVKSDGDLRQDLPLYELGITGIFTKTLDIALLEGRIDIAVHSMKDVPTTLPRGIVKAAVLKRASFRDILVHDGLDFLNAKGTIATGSLRRKAQWLHRYPMHEVVDLRGNVNTRLQKFQDHKWDGAIFAEAGLERIGKLPANHTALEWMIPAPAQGAMLIVCMENETDLTRNLAALNDPATDHCTAIEREFLKTLEGGCTAPIGALATSSGDEIHFKGALFSLDGQQRFMVNETTPMDQIKDFGKACALDILNRGGEALMRSIKMQMSK
ncbi:hydroxymethylbilane synthase [Poritiphilus flavus]|uniref:Hydroxymethylbilane synthase n=1 Tax=Poritiphilus flavus TaxID=2697053 RepID=A0A6L9E8R9_9FLAO|nr:hydroxymethylbilane synthase [Poritiphilus flavus]NAS10859.1 hydroxymethylbilane synthase [Poritiphilus flavus]